LWSLGEQWQNGIQRHSIFIFVVFNGTVFSSGGELRSSVDSQYPDFLFSLLSFELHYQLLAKSWDAARVT
jgi:hypothetical protein